ncbi:MAG TPA: hypothetical protein VIC08_16105 [Cellvibrionaceae bacterium]
MAEVHPLKLAYARDYSGELASFLATQGADAIDAALGDLPADVAASVVAKLPHGYCMRVLAAESEENLGIWLNAASLDDALVLLLHMDQSRRAQALATLGKRRRRTLEQLVVYPEDTIGALVEPGVKRLHAAMPLVEAVAILRAEEHTPEEPIWLVNDVGVYLGLLDFGAALIARSDALKLSAFLIPVKPLRAETTLVNARDFHEWLKHPAVPVTDHLEHLLGSVSRQRLISALEGSRGIDHGLAEGMGDLVGQYFRVLGVCIGDLFGARGPKR